MDIAIEEQDVETSPALMSLTSTLISKLEKMVSEVLDAVIKGWEVKVTSDEVKQLKRQGFVFCYFLFFFPFLSSF